MPSPLTAMFPKEDPPQPLYITRPEHDVFWWTNKEVDHHLLSAIKRLQNVVGISPDGEGYRVQIKPSSLPIAERVKTKLLDLLAKSDRLNDRVIVRP